MGAPHRCAASSCSASPAGAPAAEDTPLTARRSCSDDGAARGAAAAAGASAASAAASALLRALPARASGAAPLFPIGRADDGCGARVVAGPRPARAPAAGGPSCAVSFVPDKSRIDPRCPGAAARAAPDDAP
jgi:hypothetical protein